MFTETWLVQILRRRLKKELRGTVRKRAREALLGIAKVRHYDEYDARAAPIVNRGDNPEKALLMRECLEYILRVSRALPKRQAEVWILTDLFEWTAEDVSTALAISPEYQRVLLHRAHQRLRLELNRYLKLPLGLSRASAPFVCLAFRPAYAMPRSKRISEVLLSFWTSGQVRLELLLPG